MVAAGIEDVLLANEIASAGKADRLAVLAGRARVIAAVDSPGVVQALSDAARRAGTRIDVLVDMDVGLNRCGVPDEDAAVSLAATADASPRLGVAGLMGYEGRIRADESDRGDRLARAAELLAKTKAAMDAAGFDTSIVSSAGTSTLFEARADPTVTEIQAGTYALMESDLDGIGLPFVPALSLVAAVISVAPGRVVLDAGRKSIAGDYGPSQPIDAAVEGARTVAFHEEHTTLAWPGPLPALDSRIMLRPNHVRLTFNLHDTVWLVRGDDVVEELPVAARGRSE
jgi:D-serine deaminase-like pyridoxal phosphate-dependent protein